MSSHRNGKDFTNPKNMNSANAIGNDAVFPCDHCEYRATRIDNLCGHLRDKHDIAPFVCDIDGCSSAFRYYRELQKHQKSDHGSFGAWKLGDSSSNNVEHNVPPVDASRSETEKNGKVEGRSNEVNLDLIPRLQRDSGGTNNTKVIGDRWAQTGRSIFNRRL